MPTAVSGTLCVKKVSGRNGLFSVGDLYSEIGDFVVKDAILDQFSEGRYTGKFWIVRIFTSSYVNNAGRLVIELRAKVSDLQIDQEAPPSGSPEPMEPDPIDEVPAPPSPSPVPDPAPPKPRRTIHRVARVGQAPAADSTPTTGTSVPPQSQVPLPDSTPQSSPNEDAQNDLALFGEEIWQALQSGEPFKLDHTVDRARLREQSTRLHELGYSFKSTQQSWSKA